MKIRHFDVENVIVSFEKGQYVVVEYNSVIESDSSPYF